MQFKTSVLVLISCCSLLLLQGQSVVGKWRTVDDQNGLTKSIVSVYEAQNGLAIKIVEIIDENQQNALCTSCEGAQENKPIKGLVIATNLQQHKDGYYEGGKILDPEAGKWFRCKIWVNPENTNELLVRGYVGFFYRTQTWLRVKK